MPAEGQQVVQSQDGGQVTLGGVSLQVVVHWPAPQVTMASWQDWKPPQLTLQVLLPQLISAVLHDWLSLHSTSQA